jgi:hypothetical protein
MLLLIIGRCGMLSLIDEILHRFLIELAINILFCVPKCRTRSTTNICIGKGLLVEVYVDER